MKTCCRCLEPKPDSEFGVNRYYETRGAKDSKSIYCKQCNRESSAKFRARAFELLRTTRVRVSYASLGYHP